MSARETIQKEVLEEVKSISKELSQVQSFHGLLAYQQKIQSLYEKFIFLKQLNSFKYQQILDNNISETSPKRETNNTNAINLSSQYEEEKKENQKESSSDDIKVTSEKETVEKIIETKKDTEIDNIPLESKQEDNKINPHGLKPINIEIADIKSFNNSTPETLLPNPTTSSNKLNPEDLKAVKPDFNDSISFISQLFNGSKNSMDTELAVLNQTQNLEEAKRWIEEMFVKYNWKNKGPQVERLSKLIVERFES